ncbi:hypothetical protein M9H77_20866 [Catharanthus roseus]|uniref:Uncharacterized protein n=1 Tax=Catharanthus roseus TaxID=4058 RepID=A0ACC0AKR4_CATRO|nr:hypothetical protein M9H77_20866 [Catharanthus roseus]
MVLNLDDNDADEEEVVISKMSERQRRVNELLAEKESSSAAMELGSSSAAHNNNNNKKLQHNAKERIRRMRLNASYLALRALLPDISRRSKKRWSAAAIVDKVLKYIPEMENEIEKLKLSKDNAKKKQQEEQLQMSEKQSLTVSVNQVQDGQAIVQICKEEEPPLPHPNLHQVFSKFLDNIEAEQICITNASTLSICHNRICYQLHLQDVVNVSEGSDEIDAMKDQ